MRSTFTLATSAYITLVKPKPTLHLCLRREYLSRLNTKDRFRFLTISIL